MNQRVEIMRPLKTDPINECLDCHHEGREWGERDTGQEYPEVVCPKCHSYHYYIKDTENA